VWGGGGRHGGVQDDTRAELVEVGGFFVGVGLVEVLDHVAECVDGVV